MKFLSRSLVAVALGILALIPAAQGRAANSVSFANLDPLAGPLDVYIDGVRIYEALEYGMVTSYYQVGSNRSLRVSFIPIGTRTPVVDQTVTLGTGGYYTAVASRATGNPALVFVTDTLSPGGELAAVRVINLAADAVTASVGDAAAISLVGPGEASGYITFDGATLPVSLRAGVPSRIAHTVAPSAFAAGSYYTLFVTALPGGEMDTILVLDVTDRGNF